MQTEQDPIDVWKDDRLDRQQYATFLTGYLDSKCGPSQPALVLALDAPWGLGKTFFVQRWATTLRHENRPVIAFDAWENDSAEDPSICFMSELQKDLAPLYSKLPAKDKAKKRLQEKSKELVINLRRATLPTLTVIGKGLLKKTTGIAANEFIAAMTDKDSEAKVLEKISEAAPEAIEAGLNKFFEKSMQAHAERLRSVKAFRRSLEEMLEILHENKLASGPLYVFVDELDRCRPDYAIRLLEGVKHLFGAKGIVFVISTNLHQLSKAVGAVYGSNFDGYSYLKRFFDFEYQLPEPPRSAFTKLLIKGTTLQGKRVISGLDPAHYEDQAMAASDSFATIAEAFRLDLRAIQRITAIAEAAATATDIRHPILGLWLFFLATLRHKHPDEFQSVDRRTIGEVEFRNMCKEKLTGTVYVEARHRNQHGVSQSVTKIYLIDVLASIYEAIGLTGQQLVDSTNNEEMWAVPYPRILMHQLVREFQFSMRGSHPITLYGSYIMAAGFISKTT